MLDLTQLMSIRSYERHFERIIYTLGLGTKVTTHDVRRGALRDIATTIWLKGASVEDALIITGYRTSAIAKRNIRSYWSY